MCHRGARHLVILSRQADTKPGVAKLRKDLALKGVEVVAVPCDITDIEQVQVAMSQVGKTSPPVRGIIQAAMVLEVLLPAQSCQSAPAHFTKALRTPFLTI
jgi:NAD(P)-dependent dehydrogenase (short-subunit alcohol dehydrogenase family)